MPPPRPAARVARTPRLRCASPWYSPDRLEEALPVIHRGLDLVVHRSRFFVGWLARGADRAPPGVPDRCHVPWLTYRPARCPGYQREPGDRRRAAPPIYGPDGRPRP